MAYTRDGKETFEVSYPIDAIWQAIPKVIAKLEWKVESADLATHHVKIKTKGAFLSYGSKMEISLTAVDEKTTKMSITAETPVTTITAMADYGRTNERINVFIATIGKIMESS
ncbi:MAG: hypothetical protein ABSF65_02525 [Candidatus Bathyarchaeia archaeon]|jgi:hypothetical protein